MGRGVWQVHVGIGGSVGRIDHFGVGDWRGANNNPVMIKSSRKSAALELGQTDGFFQIQGSTPNLYRLSIDQANPCFI